MPTHPTQDQQTTDLQSQAASSAEGGDVLAGTVETPAYCREQMEYLDSVDGAAHMSAVNIIGRLAAAVVSLKAERDHLFDENNGLHVHLRQAVEHGSKGWQLAEQRAAALSASQK